MKRALPFAGLLALLAAAQLVMLPAQAQDAPAADLPPTNCLCTPPGGAQTCLSIDSSKLPADTSGTDDCTTLPSIIGETLKGWTCQAKPASDAACSNPVDAFAAGQAPGGSSAVTSQGTPQTQPAIIPVLNTPIPGLTFKTGPAEDTSSLLAQYVAAAYGWMISISAIAATVMFVWGAFRYLLGSSGVVSVTRGKEIMQEAIIGMLLVLGAHLILTTVNPNTLTLSALDIQGIAPGPFFVQRQEAANAITLDGCMANRNAPIAQIPASCSNGTVTSDMRAQANAVQNETGVPAFLLLGIYGNETGFNDKACPNNNCGGIKCTPPGGGPGWVNIGQSLDCGDNCALLKTKEDLHDGRGKIDVMACFKKFPDVSPDQKYKSRFEKIAQVLLQKNFDGGASWRDYQSNPNCAAAYVQKRGWATANDYAAVMQRNFKTYCLIP